MNPYEDLNNYQRDQEYSAEVLAWLAEMVNAMNEVGTSFTDSNGMTYDLGDVHATYEGYATGLGLVGSEFGPHHTVGTFKYVKPKEDK